MSSETTPPPSPPEARSGCMTAVMIGIGLILLLPGLCGLISTVAWLPELGRSSDVIGLLFLSLACVGVGVGGVFLIRNAIRGRSKT